MCVYSLVGFEVLAAVVMKELCSLGYNAAYSAESQPIFRGLCCIHLQGRRLSPVRNQHEAGSKKLSAFNGLRSVVFPEDRTLILVLFYMTWLI
jgi:hypothetical protein